MLPIQSSWHYQPAETSAGFILTYYPKHHIQESLIFMKIGIDFDGIIIDWAHLKSLSARLLYKIEIPSDRISRDYAIANNIFTEKQYTTFIESIYSNPSILSTVQPLPGALDGIRKLLQQQHSVWVITSRPKSSKHILKEWLEQFGIALPIVCTEYQPKTAACRDLDVFVDDDYRNIKPLLQIVPKLFLFSWWYNKHESPLPPCKRVTTWTELNALIG
jgi:uncharacterized HAD superfamily protein